MTVGTTGLWRSPISVMRTTTASTTTERPNRRRTSTKLAALLLALGMGAAACGDSGDDGESETDAEESLTDSTRASSSGDSGENDTGDAESGFDLDTSEEAESEGAMEDSEAMEETSDAVAADGGFFDDAPPESEVDRQEDNTFQDYGVRSFIETSRDPLSTFALDVDTASYTIGTQFLDDGVMPPSASVRVEEYVNFFDYDYSAPNDGLAVVADAGPSPFNEDNVIVRLGVQAEQVSNRDRPDANLTFVIDTSGSMDSDDRLGLVKESLTTLVRELDASDSVAIVTYSDGAEVILAPTSVRDEGVILDAIDRLGPGGSTNLEAGLREGYNLADEVFRDGDINRVILASDGVANVGLTDPDGLVQLIRDDADRGIQLVTLGVGMGNFNDVVMETLADDGDGFYAYVNTSEEADRLFGDELVSTLLTVAIDGKIQVDFDEDTVVAYRLLGFENRAVLDDDFRNDAVDAGELGAGHQVTALYELELERDVRDRDRLGTASLRWEDPETGEVIETRLELTASIIEDRWNDTDDDFRLAVTVATFAEKLRLSQYAEELTFDQIASEAAALAGNGGEIAELADLIRRAADLS